MEYRFDEDRRSARRVCLQAGGGRVVAVLSPNPQANDGQAAPRTPSLVRSSIPLDPRLRCKARPKDQTQRLRSDGSPPVPFLSPPPLAWSQARRALRATGRQAG